MPVRNYAQMYFIFVRNIHCLVAINWARVFCVITELHILRTVLSFQTKPRTTLHMFFCLKTCYGGNWAVSNHTSRVNLVLFVKIFTCKRGAKYERLFFLLKQAGPFVFCVHTSRSHFTANSGYKETPTTPSVTNSGSRHISDGCPLKLQWIYFFSSVVISWACSKMWD